MIMNYWIQLYDDDRTIYYCISKANVKALRIYRNALYNGEEKVKIDKEDLMLDCMRIFVEFKTEFSADVFEVGFTFKINGKWGDIRIKSEWYDCVDFKELNSRTGKPMLIMYLD